MQASLHCLQQQVCFCMSVLGSYAQQPEVFNLVQCR